MGSLLLTLFLSCSLGFRFSSAATPQEIHVLLTNDNGVEAPGLDALALALKDVPTVTMMTIVLYWHRSQIRVGLATGRQTQSSSNNCRRMRLKGFDVYQWYCRSGENSGAARDSSFSGFSRDVAVWRDYHQEL